MSNEQFFRMASRKQYERVAVKYCSDCDESLCPDCFSVHGTFKAFMSHYVIDVHVSADKSFELNQFSVSIKYLTSDAKSSNMMALLTPFAATSNGFNFPHVRCSSAIHDLQQ
jgi:hypothetical protein